MNRSYRKFIPALGWPIHVVQARTFDGENPRRVPSWIYSTMYSALIRLESAVGTAKHVVDDSETVTTVASWISNVYHNQRLQ